MRRRNSLSSGRTAVYKLKKLYRGFARSYADWHERIRAVLAPIRGTQLFVVLFEETKKASAITALAFFAAKHRTDGDYLPVGQTTP